jgi:hypothetical protein
MYRQSWCRYMALGDSELNSLQPYNSDSIAKCHQKSTAFPCQVIQAAVDAYIST